MGLGIQLEVVLAYAIGLVFLYIIGYLLLVPLKVILKLLFNAIIGGVVLWLINLVGDSIGIHIAINVWTALGVGILGVPGIILIFLLQIIL